MFAKIILVTGGAGFIGSHVVIALVKRYPQYMVINLDKLDYVANLKNLEEIEEAPNYKFVQGDITDANHMKELFLYSNIDFVIHCAAKSHVENSFLSSLDFTHNNVLGTHVLVNAAYMFGKVQLFIHVSTDEVYGGKTTNMKVNFETTVRQPTNPYSATKAAAECIVLSYWESFKVPVVVVRMNNVYGPHQYPEKVVPKFIELLRRNRKCFLHGSGKQARNFLYATDAADALILLLHKGSPGEIYNVGSEFEITVKDLAIYLAMKILGATRESAHNYIEYVKDRPFNDFRYTMNSNKLKTLGWKQQITWETGIEKTIQWHNDHGERWPCMEEILIPFSVAPEFLGKQLKIKDDAKSESD